MMRLDTSIMGHPATRQRLDLVPAILRGADRNLKDGTITITHQLKLEHSCPTGTYQAELAKFCSEVHFALFEGLGPETGRKVRMVRSEAVVMKSKRLKKRLHKTWEVVLEPCIQEEAEYFFNARGICLPAPTVPTVLPPKGSEIPTGETFLARIQASPILAVATVLGRLPSQEPLQGYINRKIFPVNTSFVRTDDIAMFVREEFASAPWQMRNVSSNENRSSYPAPAAVSNMTVA